MAATPTVVCRSAATCGNSESMTRTWAWLAKPATASKMIERVGFGRGGEMDGGLGTGVRFAALADLTPALTLCGAQAF
jgi:hypothetical protein